MKDLLELRDEIDCIDKQIVALYEERMEISEQVAKYKIANNKPVFDKNREISILENLSNLASNDFNKNSIFELFNQIMSISRKKQYQLLTEHGVTYDLDFTKVDKLKENHVRVVFQGLEGAYSQQATLEYFGEQCDIYHVDTWKDAMEAIKNGEADYAVLPIENSSAGIVSENYDLLVQYDNYIVAEQIIPIAHALLALEGAKKEEIRSIYSHPQSLMQCSQFLDKNRHCEAYSLKNNAVAAKKVKDDGLMTQAAIASPLTADIYGLKVLEEAIQDNSNNSTRFIIVTGKRIYSQSASRISIVFEIPHEIGSLYRMLSHFIYNGLNMTNIQSRPIPGKNWEYRFFIDFDGCLGDTAVLNALKGLEEETTFLKILGTY